MKNKPSVSRCLVPEGSRVLCALSGGADSVCLLHLLKNREDIDLAAAHFNHRIRGEESDRDERFAEALCKSLQVPFFSSSADVPALAKKEKTGLEETARHYRYSFLFRMAEHWGADVIATGHNRNDNAETVVLNLIRGTGLHGLGGIPPIRGKLIRPLLSFDRSEIEEYLKEHQIEYLDDSTNATPAYARNRVRHEILPRLEKIRPGAVKAISRMTRTVREDEEYLSSLAEKFLSSQKEGAVSVAGLLGLPVPVARRAIRIRFGDTLSFEQTEAVFRLCKGSPSARLDLPGMRLNRCYDVLTENRTEEPPMPERELLPGQSVFLPETGQTLSCRRIDCFSSDLAGIYTLVFSCSSVCGKLFLTSRRAGDTIKLPGRDGTRKLKKLLIEKKIPRNRRNAVPVVRDKNGVLAVLGLGQDEKTLPREGEAAYVIMIRACPGGKES